jgi:outer membrane lipoprotein LolB
MSILLPLLKAFTLSAIIAGTIASCATTPPDYTGNPDLSATSIHSQLSQVNDWSLFGKIGFRDKDGSYTAAINNWRQTNQDYVIDLSSTFLGLGAVRIHGSPSYVTVEESGEEPASSEYPNEILHSILGVPLPVAKLRYWMKGIPAPNSSAETVKNDLGLNQEIRQDGWQIKLSRYQNINTLPLPGLIKLEQNDIRISLAIKSWTIH